MAEQVWTATLGAAIGEVAGCFPRCELWLLAREMAEGLLMELDTRNCWTRAEAHRHWNNITAAATT